MSNDRGRWPEGQALGTGQGDAMADAQALVARVVEAAQAETEPPPFAKARVWSALEARRKERRWSRFLLPVSAGAVAVLALSLAQMRYSSSSGRGLHGTASLAGQSYTDGARRRIDVHGAADVVLGDATVARVTTDDASGIVFSLERGSLLADVRHRPANAPFRVRAPHADVKVVGTVLWVNVAGDGQATVLVGRGAVEVAAETTDTIKTTRPAGVARVAAGERWPAASVRTPDAADLALLGGAQLGGTRFAAPADSASAAAGSQAAPNVPGPGTQSRCGGVRGARGIACLDEEAASGDALRAESALFEKGWRQLRELDDAHGALATFTAARKRFPRGVLRLETDASIVQASVKVDDRPRARREIDAFFAAHPHALQGPEIHFLRGSLERADGHCERAVRELDLALRAPSEPWAGEAKTQRAACRHRGR